MKRLIALLGLLASPGCNGHECLEEPAPVDCQPLYPPSYANVYATTLTQKCAVNGSSCHSASGQAGGLVLAGEDVAYDNLVGALVVPGDASCGTFVLRTHSEDAGEQMPPGAPLSDAELCALRQWIDAGARR